MAERHPYFIFGCGSVACLEAVIKLAGEAFDLHTHSLTECAAALGALGGARCSGSQALHQCYAINVFALLLLTAARERGRRWLVARCSFFPKERDIVAHMHSNEIERGESGPGSHYPRIYTLSPLPVMICSIVPMSGSDAGRPPPRSHPRAGSMANLRISRR